MKKKAENKYKFKLHHIFIFLFSFVIFLGFAGFILRIITKIRDGHGLDYYFTGHGVQMNYIGVLSVMIAIPVIIFIAWLIQKIIDFKENLEIEEYKDKKRKNQ